MVVVVWAGTDSCGGSETEAVDAAASVAEDENNIISEGDGIQVPETSAALVALEEEIEAILSQTDGVWSVYVKNLETDETLSINNQRMYAASLIKIICHGSYLCKLGYSGGQCRQLGDFGRQR